MRMWMVNPQVLCNQHLLGEHVEMHMFAAHFELGRRLGKYAELCEPEQVENRHRELAAELRRRGFNHGSPLHFVYSGPERGHVDTQRSLRDLKARCMACRERIEAWEARRESV